MSVIDYYTVDMQVRRCSAQACAAYIDLPFVLSLVASLLQSMLLQCLVKLLIFEKLQPSCFCMVRSTVVRQQ